MKKASLTEKIINDYADVIKWGAGQVVDTYQEIDLYLLRGRNLDEKRKNLLLVLDMLDDDIEVIRKMQECLHVYGALVSSTTGSGFGG